MNAIPQPTPRMTVDEFFAWDGGGHVGKLELVNGVVRAQSYASGGHATIQGNLAALINRHLREARARCRVGIEPGIVPRFDPKRNIRKPDVVVTCSPHTKGERAFPDPVLVIEVLSPSNEDETWESIRACATIPSVVEIVAVESERLYAQVFRRDDKGNWPEPGDVVEAGGVIRLTSIGLEMPVGDVYWGTVHGE